MLTLVMVLLMTAMGSFGSFFLKKASGDGILGMLKSASFYIGGLLYFLSLLINVYLISRLDYSMVVPLCSLSYVWTMILSCKLLHEKMTKRKLCGTALMIVGIILIL